MKILIIYFSQTGNTRKAAECIAKGITEADPESSVELVKLADVDTSRLPGYDLVGLGTSVMYYQEPLNVKHFIRDLPDLAGKHWFIFCSHGAMIGITLQSMEEGLLKKGIEIAGYFDSFGDATTPFVPVRAITYGHPDGRDLELAVNFGSELIDRFHRITSGEVCKIPKPEPVTENWELKAKLFTQWVMDNYLPRLEVDLLKCTLCGTCEKACPVGGIDIGKCPPVLQDPCVYCYRCVMVCPETAIDAKNGEWGMLYDTLPDLYRQFTPVLNKAESENRFKWYVDPEKFDFPNTQLVVKKRKRWGEVE